MAELVPPKQRDGHDGRWRKGMTKPTAKMIEVLKALAKPGVVVRYVGNRDPHYYLTTDHRHCTIQIHGLVERGLAAWCKKGKGENGEYRITKAGREFLKREKAK